MSPAHLQRPQPAAHSCLLNPPQLPPAPASSCLNTPHQAGCGHVVPAHSPPALCCHLVLSAFPVPGLRPLLLRFRPTRFVRAWLPTSPSRQHWPFAAPLPRQLYLVSLREGDSSPSQGHGTFPGSIPGSATSPGRLFWGEPPQPPTPHRSHHPKPGHGTNLPLEPFLPPPPRCCPGPRGRRGVMVPAGSRSWEHPCPLCAPPGKRRRANISRVL